jgi:hypothetical protein
MESYPRQEEFEERALRNIKYFMNKNFKNVKRMSSAGCGMRNKIQNCKNDDKFHINTEIYIPDLLEILFYDFPARWSGEKIALVLKHFGLLN